MYLERLEMYDRVDSTKNNDGLKRLKSEYFIVKNYSENQKTELVVDSLVCEVLDTDYLKYGQYNVFLYKESHMTNRAKLLENDRTLVRYSQENDWVYIYTSYNMNNAQTFVKTKVAEGEYISDPKQYLDCDE